MLRQWHLASWLIPSMSECIQVKTSRFYFRKAEIASRGSSDKFFPSFTTLDGSFSFTGRSARSSIGPVVALLSGNLGLMGSSRGPSLGGRWSTMFTYQRLDAFLTAWLWHSLASFWFPWTSPTPLGEGNFISKWYMLVIAFSALWDGLSSTALKADGWLITRKSDIT